MSDDVTYAKRTGCCPRCQVDLEDDGTAVRCWKCGWELRDVDAPSDYHDVSDEIRFRSHP